MSKKNILARDSVQERQGICYSEIFNTMWFMVLLIIVLTAGCKKKMEKIPEMEIGNIIVTPKELITILDNPLMGIQSFGQKLVQVKNRPKTSVVYNRFGWDKIEPLEGVYDFRLIDDLIIFAKSSGQDAAFGIMPYSKPDLENVPHSIAYDGYNNTPGWFKAKHKGILINFSEYNFSPPDYTFKPDDKLWIIDWNDQYYIRKQKELISALAERYNGNPDLAFIDIGGIGHWGEWHAFNGLPEVEVCKDYIDHCVKMFDKTIKMINMQSAMKFETTSFAEAVNKPPYILDYAIRQGLGWRYNGMEYEHNIKWFESLLKNWGLDEAWKTTPVYWETGGNNGNRIFDKKKIDIYKKLHITGFSFFNNPIYDENVELLNELLLACGYRFVLNQMELPKVIKYRETIKIKMSWENKGVNPVYKKFILAIKLTSDQGEHIIEMDEDITKWLPGKSEVAQELTLPDNLLPGEYMLSVGLLDPYYKNPAIKLAIEGRSESGWYPMSKIKVID